MLLKSTPKSTFKRMLSKLTPVKTTLPLRSGESSLEDVYGAGKGEVQSMNSSVVTLVEETPMTTRRPSCDDCKGFVASATPVWPVTRG